MTLLLTELKDQGGWIELNRPAALNALNIEMIEELTSTLNAWRKDPQVSYVTIKGHGRAFCAGGDLRMIFEANHMQQIEKAKYFFQQEYALNLLIHMYPKPYIAILDGITMGGGMGISIHGKYRVATENTVMAMPETAIGFFPDVGARWFLHRCPGKSGLYLGLTATQIGPADALYCGLATHFVSSAKLPMLLQDIHVSQGVNLDSILNQYHTFPSESGYLEKNQDLIEKYFNQVSIEDVFKTLAADKNEFAQQTLEALKRKSPLSLRVTFNHLTTRQGLPIEEIMHQDLKLAETFLGSVEFQEGIRAAVIDKDQNPNWPSTPIFI